MTEMFKDATSFNQSIGNWDLSSAGSTRDMFRSASAFNQDLNSWNVSKVTDMYSMFRDASSFNGALGNWNVSSVTNMSSMFNGATSFDQSIENWDIENVNNWTNFGAGATSMSDEFQDIIDVSGIYKWNYFKYKFDNSNLSIAVNSWFDDYSGTIINYGHINNWNVSQVTNMDSLFDNESSFGVSDVITNPQFYDASGSTYEWGIQNVMFEDWVVNEYNGKSGAEGRPRVNLIYNSPSAWTDDEPTELDSEIQYFIGIQGYNSWISQIIHIDTPGKYILKFLCARRANNGEVPITIEFNNTTETHILNTHEFAELSYSYDITESGDYNLKFTNIIDASGVQAGEIPPDDPGETAFITNISFYYVNGYISNWDVSNVTSMNSMFRDASSFKDISNWNVSKVTDMSQLFYDNNVFNQPIGSWNVYSVTNMKNMFAVSDAAHIWLMFSIKISIIECI